MKKIATSIDGFYVLELFHAQDERGDFTKTFHAESLEKLGLNNRFKESFFSNSKQGVVRGMHFQLPPHEHSKLVYCTRGSLMDVVLDLRKNSPTFGQFASFQLHEEKPYALYIEKGLAHGFQALQDHTQMIYLTETMHHSASDAGIRYDSFGFDWPMQVAAMSPRDQAFPSFEEFKSPF